MTEQQQQSKAGVRVVLAGKVLDAGEVAQQRAVRWARRRGATLLLTLLAVGLAAIFLASFWISRNTSGETGLAFFLLLAALLFIVVYFGNNYWQWRVLQLSDMRCPHCGEALVDTLRWTKRPGYVCPHCGQDALATARQLGEG